MLRAVGHDRTLERSGPGELPLGHLGPGQVRPAQEGAVQVGAGQVGAAMDTPGTDWVSLKSALNQSRIENPLRSTVVLGLVRVCGIPQTVAHKVEA